MESRDAGKLYFRFYVVAFLDVLNQRPILARMHTIPTSDSERAPFVDAATKTFGAVGRVRNFCQEFLEKASNRPPLEIPELAAEGRALLQKRGKCPVQLNAFADTVLLYAPLEEGEEFIALEGVELVLGICAASMLLNMVAGVAIRGGITVGTGAEWPANTLYGEAVYSAYRIESEVAQYPRIALGEGILNFLKSEHRPGVSDLEVRHRKQVAEACLRMITMDTDGIPVLDYLGDQSREMLGSGQSLPIATGVQWVATEYARWVAARDQKLAERYYRWLAYCKSRGVGNS